MKKMDYIVRRFHIGVSYQTVSGVCLDCVCIPKEKFENNTNNNKYFLIIIGIIFLIIFYLFILFFIKKRYKD